MALSSTIYRAGIQLSNVDANRYEQLQLTLARHPSETMERMLARLIAYALHFGRGIGFGRGVSCSDEPDVWIRSDDGRVLLWMEVGLPDPERILKACRHAQRVILYAYGTNLERWKSSHLQRLCSMDNLCVYALDFELLRKLAGDLERSIDWTLTLMEGRLYLGQGRETLESDVQTLIEAPPHDFLLREK